MPLSLPHLINPLSWPHFVDHGRVRILIQNEHKFLVPLISQFHHPRGVQVFWVQDAGFVSSADNYQDKNHPVIRMSELPSLQEVSSFATPQPFTQDVSFIN